ncbi:MAG: hypothetical protein QNK05_15030 [Myxococcota bacterium]|nr:hypothetical protein [Myxococcota bacterium]
MDSFAFASFACTCVLGAILSVRLLLVWRRTRALPELALGVASLALTLSPILLIVGARLASSHPGVALAAFTLGVLLHPINPLAMACGVFRIFRPDARWAGALCGLVAVAFAVWAWRRLGAGEIALQTKDPLSAAISHAGRLGVYAWAAFECFRYRALLHRREQFGIGSPETAHRLALWGASAACIAGVAAIGWYGFAVREVPLLQWPLGLLGVNGLGLLAAATLWVAFFPPRAYRSLVLGES